MKKVIIILLVIQTQWSFSQKIKVLDMNQTIQASPKKNTTEKKQKRKSQKVRGLYFLHPQFDTQTVTYIAKYQFDQNNQTSYHIEKVLAAIQRLANKHQGNAFKLVDHKINPQKRQIDFLEIEIYRIDEAAFEKNLALIPKNTVFIMGNLKGKSTKKIKVNNQRRTIPPFTCLTLQAPLGEYIKINVGGIFGQTGHIKSRKDKPSQFFSFSNFGIAPGAPITRSVGVTINTGRFYPMEPSYGYFLSLMLPQETLKL